MLNKKEPNLFIDTTNWRVIFLLEANDQVIDFFLLENVVKTSDLVIEKLAKFLQKNHLQLNQIKRFYLTNGPGSYTGIRVGMTIVKTIKTIHPQVEVYLINSLLFQAGKQKAVSILDAKGQKVYLGVYQQGQAVVAEQVVLNQDLNQLVEEYEKQGYAILRDYKELDIPKNYLLLKPQFQLIQDGEKMEPLYIKDFL